MQLDRPDTLASPDTDDPQDAVPSGVSWQVIAALAVVVLAIGTAITLGLIEKSKPIVAGPLPIATVDQPGADSAACKTLMPRLPPELAGRKSRVIEGGGDGIAAWGDPAIILRCGLETPQDLTCSSALTQVGGVSWLQLTTPGLGESTYIAADRSVRVAVTVPDGSGTGPIQQISDVVGATLKMREPCAAGVLLPTDTR